MPGLPSWLSDVSRRKLRVAALGRDGLRDTINLHRFVLLKNSITQAQADSTQPSTINQSSDDPGAILPHPDVIPIPEPLDHVHPAPDSEEKWLESVLETLDDEFEGEVEVDVRPVSEEEDLDFPDLALPYDSWSTRDVTSPISIANNLLSTSSVLPTQSFPQPTSLQDPFHPLDSTYNELFVEPRYPEADYDLPISDGSSDSDSDDDDGPLTPYSGSQRSIDERGVAEPEVYVEHDSYFLYPSELDPISPQPIYYQQC